MLIVVQGDKWAECLLKTYRRWFNQSELILLRARALVPIDKLMGIVCPVKMYQGKKEIAVRDIGLSSFETPTLEWFRDIAENL